MAKKTHKRKSGGLVVPPPAWEAADTARPPAPIPGRVILWAPEAKLTIVGGFNVEPQVVGERAASGGWESIARPQLRPLSSWVGHQPLKIQADVLLDGYRSGYTVEDDLERVRSLQDRLVGDGAPRRPPWLRVLGYTPGHYSKVRWVIDTLVVVEQEYLGGRCARALVTLTLLEFVSADVALRVTASRKKAHSYVWRKGDTLGKVAKSQLGSSGSVARTQIRKANPKIKHFTRVTKGHKIKIPASRPIDKK